MSIRKNDEREGTIVFDRVGRELRPVIGFVLGCEEGSLVLIGPMGGTYRPILLTFYLYAKRA